MTDPTREHVHDWRSLSDIPVNARVCATCGERDGDKTLTEIIAELKARLEELRSVVQSPDSLDYGVRVVIAAAKACGVPNPYTGELDA